MEYSVRPIPFNPADYATHESLQRFAAFTEAATFNGRSAIIQHAVKAHALSTSGTKSLIYAPELDLPGRNIRGDIEIGPKAFSQDFAWLAGIVFHELIHSPQYVYYATRGVTQIDSKHSETERLMIALDEFEAYMWCLKRSAELSLSAGQRAEIHRRAQHALIDLDDSSINGLAQRQRFDQARDELIKRHAARHVTVSLRNQTLKSIGCYA